MASVQSAGRTARAVTQVAAGPAGRAVSGRPARALGRVAAIVVILLWSLFPVYWALNTSLTTLSGADATPAHYFPAPLVSASYRAVFGIGGAGNGIAGQLGRSLLNSAIESGAAMIITVVIAVFNPSLETSHSFTDAARCSDRRVL